jgi:hypothetical protein
LANTTAAATLGHAAALRARKVTPNSLGAPGFGKATCTNNPSLFVGPLNKYNFKQES